VSLRVATQQCDTKRDETLAQNTHDVKGFADKDCHRNMTAGRSSSWPFSANYPAVIAYISYEKIAQSKLQVGAAATTGAGDRPHLLNYTLEGKVGATALELGKV
jgi:hypothetical protein